MAETKRMTAEQVVGYLLEGEGLDVLRESLLWVVQQLMEAEVSELIGAEHGERSEERLTHRKRLPGPDVGDARRRARACDPEAQAWFVLSEFPGAAPPLRAGAGLGRAGGVRRRRLDPQGRPGGGVAGAADLEERGVADLCWSRRAGRRVPQSAARG